MAHNLKKFSTEADYSAATLNYPAVSWVTGTNSVHFDKAAPATFGGLTVHYLIDQSMAGTNATLFNGGGGSSGSESSSESGSGSGGGGVLPSKMYVDGVEETPINTWVFGTEGEHIVQYEFEDNVIPTNFIDGNIYTARNVEIGNDITEIGESGFNESYITDATIGTAIMSINNYAFKDCLSLSSITINKTSVPNFGYSPFDNNASGRKIYVPAESVTDYQEYLPDYASAIYPYEAPNESGSEPSIPIIDPNDDDIPDT